MGKLIGKIVEIAVDLCVGLLCINLVTYLLGRIILILLEIDYVLTFKGSFGITLGIIYLFLLINVCGGRHE